MFGYSKQAYYKRKQGNFKSSYDKELLRSLVMNIRQKLPKVGGKKLYFMLQEDFKDHQIVIGRDRFLAFLKQEYLQVPKRRRYHKTTNSKHWMKKYPNLIKNIDIVKPEQVWVADITYVRTKEAIYYLHLITDAYSKKIVGYKLANNLMASTTSKALKLAVKSRKYKHQLIHHSDRGLQYCSKEYTGILKENHIQISMTESYDPYENAIAERINGILKDEFGLEVTFENYQNLEAQTKQAITFYNQFRPHLSIKMLTPNKAHLQNQIQLKSWKKINRSNNIVTSI